MIGNSNLAANKLFKNSLCLSSLTLLLSSMSDIYLKNIFTEDTDVLTKMNGILNKGCKPSLLGTTYHLFLHYRCYVVIITDVSNVRKMYPLALHYTYLSYPWPHMHYICDEVNTNGLDSCFSECLLSFRFDAKISWHYF